MQREKSAICLEFGEPKRGFREKVAFILVLDGATECEPSENINNKYLSP